MRHQIKNHLLARFHREKTIPILNLLLVLSLPIILLFSITQPAAAQTQQGEVYAAIILNIKDTVMPVPLELTFDAAGGPVEGILDVDIDLDGDGRVDLIYDLTFSGTFSGFPDGQLEGTVEGSFLPKTYIDIMTKLGHDMCVATGCANPEAFPETVSSYTDYIHPVVGTWEGQISEDGSGGGTWVIDYLPSPKGNTDTEDWDRSNTWELVELNIITEVLPTQTAVTLPTQESGEIPIDSVPAEETVEDPLLTEETEDQLPASTEELPPSQVGLMAGAALLGSAVGVGMSQLLPGRRIITPAQKMAPSPATGKMVPAAQAQQEMSRMNAGWIYRSGEGWVAPHGNTFDPGRPSILTREAEEARAQIRADFKRYTAERQARLKQERIDSYSEMAERHIKGTQESLDRMLGSIDVAEVGIETTYDVAAALLVRRFPVNTVGRASRLMQAFVSKVFQETVSEGYDQVKIAADNINRWGSGEKTSYWQDQKKRVPGRLLGLFIPGGNSLNPAKALTEEVVKNSAENIFDQSLFTGS